MTYIISVVNVKGGVGKTTMVHNLSHALALMGKRILMIDLDLQGNLTDRSLLEPEKVEYSVFDMLSNRNVDTEKCIYKTSVENVEIIPSDINIPEVSRCMDEYDQNQRVLRLGEKVEEVIEQYDFVLFDLHPSIDFLFASAMIASDYYIIPIVPSNDSIKGINITSRFVKGIKCINPQVRELGIVVSNYDTRAKISKEVTDILKEVLGDRLFTSIIARSTVISQAAVNYSTIFQYKKRAICNQHYAKLAEEVMKRIRN